MAAGSLRFCNDPEAGLWLPGQLRHLKARYGLPIVFLHTDNVKEYSLSDQDLFENHGIVHSDGVPYVSEFQGVVATGSYFIY